MPTISSAKHHDCGRRLTCKPLSLYNDAQSKLDSDLFELMKKKTQATSLDISRDGSKLAVVGRDKQIRVFNLRKGKLMRVYNESMEVFEAAMATGTLGIDSIDFGRYVAVLSSYPSYIFLVERLNDHALLLRVHPYILPYTQA